MSQLPLRTSGGTHQPPNTGPASPPRPATPQRAGGLAPTVYGLDLSLTGTAVACSHGWTALPPCPPGSRKATWENRRQRIDDIYAHVINLIRDPALVVVEGPSFRSTTPSAFDRAHLWWEVYTGIVTRDWPIAVMPPANRAKYATGSGSGSKGRVIDAVARRWPAYRTDGDDNVCDAIVLMAAGLEWLGHPLTTMPAGHRAALAGVDWPEMGRAA